MAMCYLQCLYATFDGYILLSTAMYYFRHGYILLLALPDFDFVRIQGFPAIKGVCGLKARLEFNTDLLALI